MSVHVNMPLNATTADAGVTVYAKRLSSLDAIICFFYRCFVRSLQPFQHSQLLQASCVTSNWLSGRHCITCFQTRSWKAASFTSPRPSGGKCSAWVYSKQTTQKTKCTH